MAKLSIISGNPQGATFPLQSKTVIGRLNTNTIPINDSKSSRQNTLVFLEQGLFFVRDLKSRNGTFVNGESISQKQQLFSGDRIKVGNTVFLFTEEDDPGATADISQIKQDFEASKLVAAKEKTPLVATKEKSIKKESALKKGIREANVAAKKKSRYKANVSAKKPLSRLDFSQLSQNQKIIFGVGIFVIIVIIFIVSRWLTVAITS